MAATLANWLINLVGVYAALGLIFAAAFATRGVGRVDPAAEDGTWGFRLLIVPGTVALWPLLARRWLGGVSAPPQEKNPHRTAAGRRS